MSPADLVAQVLCATCKKPTRRHESAVYCGPCMAQRRRASDRNGYQSTRAEKWAPEVFAINWDYREPNTIPCKREVIDAIYGAGLTLSQVSVAGGWHESAIRGMSSNSNGLRWPLLSHIAWVLGVSPDDLMHGRTNSSGIANRWTGAKKYKMSGLAAALKKKRWTYAYLAGLVGISRETLCCYAGMTARNTMRSPFAPFYVARCIADALGMPLEEIAEVADNCGPFVCATGWHDDSLSGASV